MKRKDIFNILSPLINEVIEAQSQGKVVLTHKISFPLSKMMNRCTAVSEEFKAFQNELLKKHCELDKDGNPVIVDGEGSTAQAPIKVWKYKTDSDKEAYLQVSTAKLDEFIKFDINKIPLKELEACRNFPIISLAKLQELDLVSELRLA